MIKINISGDYVQLIYVDPVQESVQQELKSDTDAFECSYDSEGKLYMQFGLMRFENPDPTDFTINGSAVSDAADFISKLNALFTGGGGGGATIYTGDGSLSGDRTIDLNGHILVFQILSGGEFRIQGPVGSPALSVIPYDGITNFERATVAAHDPTGSDNLSQIQVSTTDTTASFSIYADYQDGTKLTEIEANSAAGISTLTYTADTHTFNGVINLPTQAAPASPNDGDIWREDNTDTGLKIRINGLTKTITVS